MKADFDKIGKMTNLVIDMSGEFDQDTPVIILYSPLFRLGLSFTCKD